jgi:hypothetical protein
MERTNLRARKARFPGARLDKLADRASNAPQGMRARRIEAAILEKMPLQVWFTCTSVSRLVGATDDRNTRARLDRLVRDDKMERKRERGTHGFAYFYRRLP